MNELPISFHRKKIPIFAFIISQMRRLNDEWQFPTHWFWPLVNGDNHAYGEPASSPPVGHPATPHHHQNLQALVYLANVVWSLVNIPLCTMSSAILAHVLCTICSPYRRSYCMHLCNVLHLIYVCVLKHGSHTLWVCCCRAESQNTTADPTPTPRCVS